MSIPFILKKLLMRLVWLVCFVSVIQVVYSQSQLPPGNIDYAMEYFPSSGGIIMHGGWCEPDWSVRNEMWLLNNQGWHLIEAPDSPYFAHHSMTYDPYRGVLILCGNDFYSGGPGIYRTWEYYGDTWTGGPDIPTTIKFGDAEIAFDIARNRVVAYISDWEEKVEIWEYNGTNWQNRSPLVMPPACPDGALMEFDMRNANTVLVLPESTWLWDGSNWFQAGVPPQNAQYGAMVFDSIRQEMILLTTTMETWVFDGMLWVKKNPVHSPEPSPNGLFCLAFDPVRQKAVFFGGESPPMGNSAIYPTNTWEWNGEDWKEFPSLGEKGDINGDGTVDISDVILCLR
ncbi:MAG: hypothetical protein NC907_01555 [Candidatus Omnitrophica bacterium]|nr:hypothetical protein [Candidatus Omnitrophota bacterium]